MKIMKQYFKIAIAAMAALALAGCSSLMEDENGTNDNEVKFTTNLSRFETKAFTESGFTSGDAIGIVVMEPLYVDNIKYVYNGNTLTSDNPIYWPKDYEGNIYFGAYYPYDPELSLTREQEYVVKVKKDQSTLENYRASDFVIANSEAKPGQTVHLEFEHALSRMDVSVSEDLKGKVASLSVGGVHAEYSTWNEAAVGDSVSIKAGELMLSDGSTVWSVIVVPEEKARPEIEIVFHDGTTRRVQVNKGIDFESGMRYQAVISTKEDGSLEAEFVYRVFDWLSGEGVYMEPVSTAWYVCGDFTNWAADEALLMEDAGKGIYTLTTSLPRYAQFKFIRSKSWDVNLGGTEKGTYDDYCTPEISSGQSVSLTSGGYNLLYAPGGQATIYLDTNSKTAWIEGDESVNPPAGDGNWSIIGSLGGDAWSTDIPMHQYSEDGGLYALIYYEAGQEFKLRCNGSWDVNRGIDGGNGLGGHYAVQDGPNITLPSAGFYEIFYHRDTDYLYIADYSETNSWCLTGSIMNLNWESDLSVASYYYDNSRGPVLVFDADCYEGEEFKLRFQNQWYFNFGLSAQDNGMVYPGEYYSLVRDGANMKIATSGKYRLEFCLYDPGLLVTRTGDISGGQEEKDYSFSIDFGLSIQGTRGLRLNAGADIAYANYVFYEGKIDDEERAFALASELDQGKTSFSTLRDFPGDGSTRYAELNYTAGSTGYNTIIVDVYDAGGQWQGWYYYWFYIAVDELVNATWTSMGSGRYTDEIIATLYAIESLTWDVEVQKCNEDPSRIRIVYPYDGKFAYNEAGDWDTSRSYDIEIIIPDESHVYILPQKLGLDWGYGMKSLVSLAGYYISNGKTFDEIPEEAFGKVENGVISFPSGTLLINLPKYSYSGLFRANDGEKPFLVLPGYTEPAAAPAARTLPAGQRTVKRDLEPVL